MSKKQSLEQQRAAHSLQKGNRLLNAEEEKIFGSEAKSSKKQVGEMIFFDALPLHPVRCEIDILTPHHPAYYQNPDQFPPGDWEIPLPIP